MKEATGELTGSVIVVSAVALLTAFFFMFIWPIIKDGMQDRATCANAMCDNGYDPNTLMAYCKNPNDGSDEVFMCPFRG